MRTVVDRAPVVAVVVTSLREELLCCMVDVLVELLSVEVFVVRWGVAVVVDEDFAVLLH